MMQPPHKSGEVFLLGQRRWSLTEEGIEAKKF
jgi:hypothetical protein